MVNVATQLSLDLSLAIGCWRATVSGLRGRKSIKSISYPVRSDSIQKVTSFTFGGLRIFLWIHSHCAAMTHSESFTLTTLTWDLILGAVKIRLWDQSRMWISGHSPLNFQNTAYKLILWRRSLKGVLFEY